MERFEFLRCLYRDAEGRIVETAYPKGEPDPYDVPADLHCPSYAVRKGLFGPPKLENVEVVIFNTRGYRRDLELEELAKDRLVQEILRKEGAELVQAAGGLTAIKSKIEPGPFWEESG